MSNGKLRSLHLVCHAHLDPAWLWQWEEGAAAALATFRTAAQLGEAHDGFVFNQNEALLYQWIEEFDPALFERIKKLVQAGRWHICGGWYLQPDCNMPAGESLVRQILCGRRYFESKFGVAPDVAFNVDSFGHSRGLVQILAKSDYRGYLFGRPRQEDCPLRRPEFIWEGYDGSTILATRFREWYNTPPGKSRGAIEKFIREHKEADVAVALWGVGDHGGGATKQDIEDLSHLIEEHGDIQIRHSTAEFYFEELESAREALPTIRKSMNPWAPGCYTSQIEVKRRHRRLENELYFCEKMCSAAAIQNLLEYPALELAEAQRDMLFGEFHDILAGSSVQAVEEQGLQRLSHGLEILSRVKARAFFALARGERKAPEGEYPILVFNPLPFDIATIVDCEFQLDDVYRGEGFPIPKVTTAGGEEVPAQAEEESSSLNINWRKRVVFKGALHAGRMNRFIVRMEPAPQKPEPTLTEKNDFITFKTKDLHVGINARTGLIDYYRIHGVDFVARNAFRPVVMEDDADSWGSRVRGFGKQKAAFHLMTALKGSQFSGFYGSKPRESVRIVEDGPVRSVIEALFSYGNSAVVQRYKLPKTGTEIELELRVYWNEKDRILKLAIPTYGRNNRCIGQTVYGTEELYSNGNESVSQKWLAVLDDNKGRALTCINDGIYGSSFRRNILYLSLARGAAYAAMAHRDSHVVPQDQYSPRMDQREHVFRFWLNAGEIEQRMERIDREALSKNEAPFALAYNPPGEGEIAQPLAQLYDEVIQMIAVKKAEEGDDLIVRLFEPTGQPRKTVLALPALSITHELEFAPFEIKTLRIDPRDKSVKETNLLEQ